MDNASHTRQQMAELLMKLNESSVNHCNLVKILQSMEDDLGKSVTEFHTLLDEIEKLATEDGDVLSLVEIKAVFSAIEAFKLSFVYHRAFEGNKDRLCGMIFNMEKLKRHPLPVNTNNSNYQGAETLEKHDESHCSDGHNHNRHMPGSGRNVLEELQEPAMAAGHSKNSEIGFSIASALHSVFESANEAESTENQISSSIDVSSLSLNSNKSSGVSPSSQKMDDCVPASQCSSCISVGSNVQMENENFSGQYFSHDGDYGVDFVLPIAEEVIVTNEMEYSPEQPTHESELDNEDTPRKIYTDADLAVTPTSTKKRMLREEHLENALGFGCARDMPFSKEFIEKAKGNHFLKKFISVRPSNSNKNMRMKISPQSAPSRKINAETKASSQEPPVEVAASEHTNISSDPKSPSSSRTHDCQYVLNESISANDVFTPENSQPNLESIAVEKSPASPKSDNILEEVKDQPPETPVEKQQDDGVPSFHDISDDDIEIVYERKAEPRLPMNVADVPLPPAKRQKIDEWSNVTNAPANLLSAFMGKMLPMTYPYQFLNPNSYTQWSRLLNPASGIHGLMMNPGLINQNHWNANIPGGSGISANAGANIVPITPEAPTNHLTSHTTGLNKENLEKGTEVPMDPFSSHQQNNREHPHS